MVLVMECLIMIMFFASLVAGMICEIKLSVVSCGESSPVSGRKRLGWILSFFTWVGFWGKFGVIMNSDFLSYNWFFILFYFILAVMYWGRLL
ncbi:hypothetical protein M758_7G118300 [Ceratodon purpureus]|nr:hypothetical protein M758_7G118300 [Ceratodon purpureus]